MRCSTHINLKRKAVMRLRKKPLSGRDKKVLDAIRDHNKAKYNPKTAPKQAIYVGMPWKGRKIDSVKRECDSCGIDIAVDRDTKYMADNSATILCVSCAFNNAPKAFLRDVADVKKRIKL